MKYYRFRDGKLITAYPFKRTDGLSVEYYDTTYKQWSDSSYYTVNSLKDDKMFEEISEADVMLELL